MDEKDKRCVGLKLWRVQANYGMSGEIMACRGKLRHVRATITLCRGKSRCVGENNGVSGQITACQANLRSVGTNYASASVKYNKIKLTHCNVLWYSVRDRRFGTTEFVLAMPAATVPDVTKFGQTRSNLLGQVINCLGMS